MKTWKSARSGSPSAAALLALLVLLGAGAVWAQETETFGSHYKRARVLFNSGQYDKAIPEFQAAYELSSRPLVIFNLAQAHRLAGHQRDALALYERYLRLDPQTDLRPEIEGYTTEIKAQLAAEQQADRVRAEQPAPPGPAPAPATAGRQGPMGPIAEPAARPAALVPPAPQPVPAPARRRPGHLGIAGWVLAGAGVLALGVGGTLLALDGRPQCDLQPGQLLCPTVLRTEIPAIVALAGGGALLLSGAVMVGLDYRRTREGGQLALLTMTGTF